VGRNLSIERTAPVLKAVLLAFSQQRYFIMAVRTVDITCGGCGMPLNTEQKKCPSCGNAVIIETFNSVYAMPMPMVNKIANATKKALTEAPEDQQLNNSIAMCYLKLKLYDKALEAFEKAMVDNFDNSETFFYAAICLLKGQKAFLTPRPAIDKIEEYVKAALMLEPDRGIYHYFWAYIKYDFFSRKFYNTSPTYQEELQNAKNAGTPPSPLDIEQLYGILGVSRPEVL
jgi:tetratricopeptide (TPR) repeat protein